MKILVARIPDDGMDQEETYDTAALELETDIVHFDRPLHGCARVTKMNQDLFVDVKMDAHWQVECCRCLARYPVEFAKALRLHYKVQPTDEVDVTNELREETMIEYPWKPLCKPDCLGLCPACGHNLNDSPCGCPQSSVKSQES